MRYVLRPDARAHEPDAAALVRRLWTVVVRLPVVVSVVAGTAGIALLFFDQAALAVASLGLAATVYGLFAFSGVWDRLDDATPPAPGSHATAFRAQAAALVTLQGVVLTLVLTLAGDDPSATIRVAAVALVVGVLVGLMQGGLVALGVSGSGQIAIATILFNLTIWACAFGLLCLAAELVVER